MELYQIGSLKLLKHIGYNKLSFGYNLTKEISGIISTIFCFIDSRIVCMLGVRVSFIIYQYVVYSSVGKS